MTACRFCGAPLTFMACDLGDQPLANALVPMPAPETPDPRLPLRVMVCEACLLVQLDQTADPAVLFGQYSYLSSVSSSWLAHAERFAAMAVRRFGLNHASLVVEVGSNDGYLLRWFLAAGVPSLGIDPAANIAAAARAAGIPTRTAFFGAATAAALAAEGKRADLLIANNVMAHVPDLPDFVRGLAAILAPDGVLSIEVPHALSMLLGAQFDTIYHEHVFYFSALVLTRVLESVGLTIVDVERLPTHGGSLRLFARHASTGRQAPAPALAQVLAAETAEGLHRPGRYRALGTAATRVIGGLRAFLGEGRRVAAYGAAAKGTMLLNAAGIGAGQVMFVADANPLKQGHLIPGCRIPIVPPDRIRLDRPDFLLILPWNIAGEIMDATRFIGAWGGRFAIPLPEMRVIAP